MDEKEREEFLKAALDQHGRVREQLIRDMESASRSRGMMGVVALAKQRRELESLGRWVINRCLIQGLKL